MLPDNSTSHSHLLTGSDQRISIREYVDRFARNYPAFFALAVFASIICAITLLLLLPHAKAGPGSASPLEALFTATSAVCVTGLTIVETASYWTPLGHIIIAIGMQIGGLGVMTIASVLGLTVSRHIGLTQRILTATEHKSHLGDVARLLRAVIITSVTAETVLTAAFMPAFLTYGHGLLDSFGQSVFMAISTFNNGGFSALPGGFEFAASDWGFCIPIIIGTMIGAIGFPVIVNVAEHWKHPRKWNLHSKITIVTYTILFFVGALAILALEWNNAATLASMNAPEKILASLTHSATARSSGIATVSINDMKESTWWLLDGLMFVGSGSASTGGGIKVSTFAVLILAIIAEARGDRDAEAFGKRIGSSVIRLAISATFLGATLVAGATLIILHVSNFSLSQVLFETISAFGTCGLSLGITAELPTAGKIVIIVLMYLGRVGTMTFAAALALRHRRRVVRLPEEHPIIG